MTKSIFDYDCYKNFLKSVIDSGERGIVKRLAEAGGCQRSYLSQALNSHVHLTADHLFGIGQFLQLDSAQSDYLLLLLEKERASSSQYKQLIENKIDSLLSKSKRLSKRIPKDKNKKINEKYYSTWYYSALHMATSIYELKSEADFSKHLNLPISLISNALRELESWELIEFENGAWIYKGSSALHLEDKSLLTRANHINWRTKAMNGSLAPAKDLHYTSVFTVSKKDAKELREQLLNFIQEQRKQIATSGAEELVSFCCDFFDVSES